jgi:TonB-dependent receptor
MGTMLETSFKRTLLAVAVIAASGVSISAYAQIAPDQSASDTDPETVIVTGTRAALTKSRDMKRDATIVQDSISATELGRFPDDNVADSLTHITGISVTRTKGGEGQYISVRGLGSGYNIVTLNNRILATDGDGRDFAFDVLPSEVISGADVMKSAQASQIEGSIGGSVNLRSARPLDGAGFHASVRGEGEYNDLSEKTGYKLSGVVSNTFADETMGILLGAVYSDKTVRTDSLDYQTYNPDSPGSYDVNNDGHLSADEENLLGSCCIAFGSVFEEKKRYAVSGVYQWAPSDSFKMTVDALVTRLNSPQIGYNQAYYVESAEGRWSDVVVKDHLITSMTVNELVPEIATITNHRVVDTTQFGWKGEWDATENLKLMGDVYRSTSKRDSGGKDTFVVSGIAGNNIGHYQATEDGLPNISVTLEDGRDLATSLANGDLGNADYGLHYVGLSGSDIKDTVTGGAVDGKYAFHDSVVTSFNFGLSSTDREKTRDSIGNDVTGGSCQYCNMYDTTFASLGTDVVSTVNIPNFMRNAGGSFPKSFVKFDVPAYLNALKQLDGKPIIVDGVPTGEVFDASKTLPEIDPTNSYNVSEKTSSAYFEAELAGEKWFGNLGARVVHTETASKSAINQIIAIDDPTPDIPTSSPDVTYSPAVPVSQDGSYTKVLPSANVGYWLDETLVARFAVAEVMARPSLHKLAPTRTDNTLDRTYLIMIAGDPNLKPAEAVQQDISLEWYYAPKSALTGAVFAKQIKNFITSQTDEHVDIGVPGYLYTVTRPINGDKADVLGLEIGLQHFFENGFGVNAKFTKTNTKAYSGGEHTGQLEGVAPTASSIALLYEAHGLNAQIAFDYTSKFTQTTNAVAGLSDEVDPVLWVTASASYAFDNGVDIFIEGKNLSDAIHRSNLGRSDTSYGFETWGRSMSAGLSMKF